MLASTGLFGNYNSAAPILLPQIRGLGAKHDALLLIVRRNCLTPDYGWRSDGFPQSQVA
jgi:hypothetical protein